MAIVQNPVTGRSKKKMGNVVFSTQFGKNTMRSKPVTVRNPRTTAQTQQRGKMKFAMAILRTFTAVFRLGFAKAAVGMSAFNYGFRDGLAAAVSGVSPNFTFTPANLMVARGNGLSLPSGNFTESGPECKTQFDVILKNSFDKNDDKAILAIYNTELNEVAFSSAAVRSDATAVVTTPTNWATGNHVSGYLFFVSADGTRISDSQYVGTIVLA